ncbi:MAG: hypothetical protein K1X68_09010 [Saprospiraceae bacterium]|nr:hypothetical protein [Saprospiraceae bacterium]HMW38636.1 hypothetical protein [Saprospiraceae bacterium]HMX86899.1 hypothetical protein [Saprospiraceae bacterium]HMZ38993.1 hypothetical protein [Saprospiraceae bacterium]HNA65173.1 hypothetical protein [Saprospiraceae bacterium]
MIDQVLTSASKYVSEFVAAERRRSERNEKFQSFLTYAGHRLEMSQIMLHSRSEWRTTALGNGLFFLPIVGSLDLCDSTGNQYNIAPEELMFCPTIDACEFQCSNGFDSDIVFYAFHFFADADNLDHPTHTSFKLESKNMLFGAGLLNHWKMGVFDSRIKSKLVLKKEASLFVTCLRGSFEFDERLLNQGDSIYYNELQNAEFESLTEFAILLTIELNNNSK